MRTAVAAQLPWSQLYDSARPRYTWTTARVAITAPEFCQHELNSLVMVLSDSIMPIPVAVLPHAVTTKHLLPLNNMLIVEAASGLDVGLPFVKDDAFLVLFQPSSVNATAKNLKF